MTRLPSSQHSTKALIARLMAERRRRRVALMLAALMTVPDRRPWAPLPPNTRKPPRPDHWEGPLDEKDR